MPRSLERGRRRRREISLLATRRKILQIENVFFVDMNLVPHVVAVLERTTAKHAQMNGDILIDGLTLRKLSSGGVQTRLVTKYKLIMKFQVNLV